MRSPLLSVGRLRRLPACGSLTVAALAVTLFGVTACGSGSSDSSSSDASAAATTHTAAASTTSAAAPAGASVWTKSTAACGSLANFVDYVCGKPGAADPTAKPVLLGWVNNQGGSIQSEGPEATDAAQLTVDWINKYAGGIGGHPLKLATCFVGNSEEEGKACADKFLANKDIQAMSYGSVAVGAQTINSGIAGKIPLIEGFAINPSDVTNPNTYVLYTASPYDFYSWGAFAQQRKAKTIAIVYPQGTGFQNSANAVLESAKSIGIKAKNVGYDPKSTNLVGALVAADASTADMVVNIGGTPSNCVSIQKALKQLHVSDDKVLANFSCALSTEKDGYGGDIPHWFFGESQSGDALTDSAVGGQYRAALAAFGATKSVSDVWYSGMFGSVMTIAQFMNKIGYDKISAATLKSAVKSFHGPLLLGEPNVECGKYPAAPANCGGGNRFFQYLGNDKYAPAGVWTDIPLALQKKLHARGT